MPYCRCCETPDAIYGPARAPDGLPTAAIVCGLCSKHQGSHEFDLKKKDRVHKEMWAESKREALEDLTETYDAKLAAKDAEIERLEHELASRPIQVVTENLDLAVVAEAHGKAQSAYRSRDSAFRQLTRVHMLHHETRAGFCRCGKPIDDCEIAALVEGSRALRTWEWVNAERRRKGQVHSLPRDHPGIVDARWDPEHDEIREFDYYEEFDAM